MNNKVRGGAMRIGALLFSLSVTAGIAGCDFKVYEMQKAENGNVLVLNTITGSIQTVSASQVAASPSPDPTTVRVTGECDAKYAAQGVHFQARYRELGDQIYYSVSVQPGAPDGKTLPLDAWNKHMDAISTSRIQGPRVLVNFYSIDGFELANSEMAVSAMTKGLDASGIPQEQHGQGRFQPGPEVRVAIASCRIAFAGFPEVDRAMFKAQVATTAS